ncbi:right-handed parallel beta-helix repeat-containing protein [bacterium]|nr:right-handed parallel beta-helix repeat-containing protein [bacterium]
MKLILLLAIVVFMADFAAAASVFNYQGHLKKDGANFTGTADFYFAIYRKDGATETFLWVNDDGDLSALPPASGVPVTVEDGHFSLEIGDTSLPNMSALPAAIFEDDAQLFMRVWVDAGDGVQQLSPDKRVHLGPGFGYGDEDVLTIYVDGISGDDLNSGLRPNRAKKTIQGGIDALPPVINGESIVQIADGIYEEGVSVFNIALAGKNASLLVRKDPDTPGDVILQPGSTGAVYGFRIAGVPQTISFKGLTIQGYTSAGMMVDASRVAVEDCTFQDNVGAYGRCGIYALKASSIDLLDCTLDNNQEGIRGLHNSYVRVRNSTVTNSQDTGVRVGYSTYFYMENCTIDGATNHGIYLNDNASADIRDTTVRGCGLAGLNCITNSYAMLIRITSDGNKYGIWSDRGGYVMMGSNNHQILNNDIGLYAIHRSTIEYYLGTVTLGGNSADESVASSGLIIKN